LVSAIETSCRISSFQILFSISTCAATSREPSYGARVQAAERDAPIAGRKPLLYIVSYGDLRARAKAWCLLIQASLSLRRLLFTLSIFTVYSVEQKAPREVTDVHDSRVIPYENRGILIKPPSTNTKRPKWSFTFVDLYREGCLDRRTPVGFSAHIFHLAQIKIQTHARTTI
jgi:hypothetical protein